MATAEKRQRAATGQSGWIGEQSLLLYRVSKVIISLVLHFWVRRYRVIGAKNVPPTGGIFLIANHTSALDPFVLGESLDRVPRGPGKIELFKNLFVAWYMRKLGIFPLRRDILDAAAVRTMVRLYRAGKLVIVYPEGGRSPTGEVQKFDQDFARLAIKLKAPLVPAGIAGARHVLPIGSLVPRPNTPLAVVYGEPFDLSPFYGVKVTPEIADRAAEVMRDRVVNLVAEAQQEVYELRDNG